MLHIINQQRVAPKFHLAYLIPLTDQVLAQAIVGCQSRPSVMTDRPASLAWYDARMWTHGLLPEVAQAYAW